MSIEELDHTADIGVEIDAGTLAELYACAAKALTDAVTDVAAVRAAERREVRLTAADREQLMVDWLEELIYFLDVDAYFVGRAYVELSATAEEEAPSGDVELHATVAGERLDPSRHPHKVAIKGVTYHQLRVWCEGGRWRARVIFDI